MRALSVYQTAQTEEIRLVSRQSGARMVAPTGFIDEA